jgi:hypothetical protein
MLKLSRTVLVFFALGAATAATFTIFDFFAIGTFTADFAAGLRAEFAPAGTGDAFFATGFATAAGDAAFDLPAAFADVPDGFADLRFALGM